MHITPDQAQQRYNIACNSEIANKDEKLQRCASFVVCEERNDLVVLDMNPRPYARVFLSIIQKGTAAFSTYLWETI